jgi:RNA polymerase sigma factor (sigma-70 family)
LSPLAFSLRFLQTQSDAQLAKLAGEGHERAFEALVRRYRKPLLIYCRRMGSPEASAEDTLQQGLLQAWTAIRTGIEVRDPHAWLYRIVHNVAVSNQRRRRVVAVELQETAGANGADHEAERRMAAREALEGLAALPEMQREVMVSTAVDGLSHEEVASVLGLSSGAVRGLIYRARAALRAAAAALLPGPVIGWALRGAERTRSPGVSEALAGGGSAALGGVLVKAGAIAVTAGALATAGITSGRESHRHHHAARAAAAAAATSPTGQAGGQAARRAGRLLVADFTRAHETAHTAGSASRHGRARASGQSRRKSDGTAGRGRVGGEPDRHAFFRSGTPGAGGGRDGAGGHAGRSGPGPSSGRGGGGPSSHDQSPGPSNQGSGGPGPSGASGGSPGADQSASGSSGGPGDRGGKGGSSHGGPGDGGSADRGRQLTTTEAPVATTPHDLGGHHGGGTVGGSPDGPGDATTTGVVSTTTSANGQDSGGGSGHGSGSGG